LHIIEQNLVSQYAASGSANSSIRVKQTLAANCENNSCSMIYNEGFCYGKSHGVHFVRRDLRHKQWFATFHRRQFFFAKLVDRKFSSTDFAKDKNCWEKIAT